MEIVGTISFIGLIFTVIDKIADLAVVYAAFIVAKEIIIVIALL